MRAAPALLALCALAGCASPGERFLGAAESRGFAREVHRVGGLPLVVLRRGSPRAGAPLHVYLDGDGTPFVSRRRVASDPSSRERLVLDLMAADPAPSLLVGRPCYYLDAPACTSALWTNARYGEAVVAALAATIEATTAAMPDAPLRLVGYSGGGTLAMLLAPRLPRVEAVVTVAANLDVAAWARHHDYAPLDGSLDPARAAPLPAHILQHHFVGGRDENVPAALVQGVAARQRRARVEVIADYGHACCWSQAWPRLLAGALAAPE